MARRALLALAVSCCAALPGGAHGAPRVTTEVRSADAAVAIAVEDVAKPRFAVTAAAVRYTITTTVLTTTGPVTRSYDYVVHCLARGGGGVTESGCTAAVGGPAVTTGTLLPEGAAIRVRVPVERRKGGWLESDLRLVATGAPYLPPVTGGYYPAVARVAGLDLPAGASVHAGGYRLREAGVTGTLRTDRAKAGQVRTYPFPYGTAVVRADTFSGQAYANPTALTEALRAATVAALPGWAK